MSLKQVFLDIFTGGETVVARQLETVATEIEKAWVPRPRLATVRHAPSREDFIAWRDNPVTQFVFAAMRAAQQAQHDMWHEASWVSGNADQTVLTELRARADAYAAIEEAAYEAFCEWAGVDPANG